MKSHPEQQNRTQISDPGIEYRILAPVCLVLFAGMLRVLSLQPFLPQIADDLDSAVALIGQTATISFLTAAVFGLFTGPIADFYGRKRMILSGQTMLILSTLLIAAATNYWMLIVGAISGGIGAAMNQSIAMSVVIARFQGDTMRRALSYAQGSATSSAIIGIPLLTLVGAFTSWRVALLTLAILLFIGLILTFIGMPQDSVSQKNRFSPKAVLSAYRPIINSRSMLRIYSAHSLRAIGAIAPVIFFASYLQEDRGVDLRYISLVLIAAGVGNFLGNIAAGNWLTMFRVNRLFVWSTTLSGVFLVLTYVSQANVIITVAVFSAAIFLLGVGFNCLLTMVGSTTPAGKATTMSLNSTIFTVSSALAVLLGGTLIATVGYTALGIVFPVLLFAAAVLIWQPRDSVIQLPNRNAMKGELKSAD